DIMIECSECTTFVSESEAIIKDGKFFCSKQCAKLR
ncbi:MAG TPA: Prokaryotic metallothionein, partial [Sulfurospirillum sp. UBA11407]